MQTQNTHANISINQEQTISAKIPKFLTQKTATNVLVDFWDQERK